LKQGYNDPTQSENRRLARALTGTLGQGTGCAWMCDYCANNLGPYYYFVDNVCIYQPNIGCLGNPIAGKTYTCCVLLKMNIFSK
jgi:hypothetical protein